MRQSSWAKTVHSLSFFHPILVLPPLCLALRAERTEIFPTFQLVEFRSVVTCLFLVPQQWAIFSSNWGGDVMRDVNSSHAQVTLFFWHRGWKKWSMWASVCPSTCTVKTVKCVSLNSSLPGRLITVCIFTHTHTHARVHIHTHTITRKARKARKFSSVWPKTDQGEIWVNIVH